MAKHPKTITLSKFRGLDNKNPDNRTDPSFLCVASNIDIDSTGGVRKRLGYSEIVAGNNMHSLWGNDDVMYFFNDDVLTRLNEDGTTTALQSGYAQSRTDFYRMGDHTYFTSKEFNGVIEGDNVRAWGIMAPSNSVVLDVTHGGAQAAITYVADDGRESGARLATSTGGDLSTLSTIDVSRFSTDNPGDILISNIPTSTDPTVVGVNVYITKPNGEVLGLAGTIPNGTSTFSYNTNNGLMSTLQTQFITTAPYGDQIGYYNGRMYIADENILWYSEPGAFEWFNPSTNFFTFPSPITNVMPVDDGIYITADRLYFLEGNGPERFRQTILLRR